MDTDAILAEREKTHGDYDDTARVVMRLVGVLSEEATEHLTYVQYHSLHMIMLKVARIIAGDANFKDHWDDIAGYAKLVVDRCTTDEEMDNEALPIALDPKEDYAVEDHQRESLGKTACSCIPGRCLVDGGYVPKYVYCRQAEEMPTRRDDPFDWQATPS